MGGWVFIDQGVPEKERDLVHDIKSHLYQNRSLAMFISQHLRILSHPTDLRLSVCATAKGKCTYAPVVGSLRPNATVLCVKATLDQSKYVRSVCTVCLKACIKRGDHSEPANAYIHSLPVSTCPDKLMLAAAQALLTDRQTKQEPHWIPGSAAGRT